ncbi:MULTISPECIES: Ig-like domain-containing protein [Brevibacillus]|uniref:BIG2 domain-containing protein n=1 Tax=Brevibacillus parabrevis TaxID=54914 RepID=A0A4Y3P884_BREPA|nr:MULTISPECIES: Ig-like domain-containing protein [Brevibacillus]MBU8712800.1 Ig-like domain-containing protein [Brevibacillus parabrevis]MDR5000423.1 Ig-like domain-containing protein [Brevibacillus parabrevis]NRQ52824.1 Ig-like domain-containing protein [Brevibacillus sp. HD1.4A]RNB96660.1 hypothetical protein EDM60_04840 [Brevibacillus parabrevis]UED70383.1 Ig-like domain-containing protein [Brevibacillus sp. HD3.3A]
MFWKKTMLLFLAALLFVGTGSAGVGLAAEVINRLVLTKNEVTVELGDTVSVGATALYESGKTEDVTVKTNWQSPDQGKVINVYSGQITAKAVGNAVVTAEYMGQTAIVNVTVTKKVKALSLNQQSVNTRIGEEKTVELTAYYSEGEPEKVTEKADWSIDKPAVATVINGKIRGLSSGTATITAKFGSQSTSMQVSVEIAHRLDPDKTQLSLLLGESQNIVLTAIYPDGSEDKDVAAKAEWSSDNAAVADAIKGKITAYSAGTATITATYGTKTATIKVDVDNTQRLVVSPQNVFLKVGAEQTVKLEATYANSTTPVDVKDKAEWSSDKENVAYYSNGKIHAVASGEAVITAKYSNKTVQILVDVEVPRSLDIIPSYLTMQSGKSVEVGTAPNGNNVVVKAYFADGQSEYITDKLEWSSDQPDIVFASGKTITAYKAGSATLTAKYGGKTANFVVDVDVPQSLTANPSKVAIQVGDVKQITVTAAFPNASSEDVTQKVTWTSSAPAVATVRQGLVTGVATGAATITATFGTRSITIPVSVGVLQSLTVDKKSVVLSKGDSQEVKLTATYADGTVKNNINEQATWTSTSAAVAEVNAGKITAIGSGKATITGSFEGKSVTVTVEVDQAQTLTINPRILIINVNDTASIELKATDASGATIDVSKTADWTSTNLKVADVENGKVRGLANGRATITFKYGSKSVSLPVEVGIVTKLEADKRFVSLKSNGGGVQITLTATMSDGRTMDVTNMADWKVSNYKIADVSKGLVKGLAFGKATISAKYSDKSVSIPVDVDTLKYLKTDVVQVVMSKGESKQVSAIATYMDGTEANVTKPALWTTSRLLVADVKDGIIKATGSGKATIYVSYGGKKTPIVVTVR